MWRKSSFFPHLTQPPSLIQPRESNYTHSLHAVYERVFRHLTDVTLPSILFHPLRPACCHQHPSTSMADLWSLPANHTPFLSGPCFLLTLIQFPLFSDSLSGLPRSSGYCTTPVSHISAQVHDYRLQFSGFSLNSTRCSPCSHGCPLVLLIFFSIFTPRARSPVRCSSILSPQTCLAHPPVPFSLPVRTPSLTCC